jgi:hypothetical protein
MNEIVKTIYSRRKARGKTQRLFHLLRPLKTPQGLPELQDASWNAGSFRYLGQLPDLEKLELELFSSTMTHPYKYPTGFHIHNEKLRLNRTQKATILKRSQMPYLKTGALQKLLRDHFRESDLSELNQLEGATLFGFLDGTQ